VSRINVVDASAVLAFLQQERGEDIVERALDEGATRMTTVNYCEVLSKLCDKGIPPAVAVDAVDDLGITLADFDADLARRAASIRKQTMPIGASLGDRACLALAQQTVEGLGKPPINCEVYTAEPAWGKLKWPFKLVLIRAGKSS
jgi:ribonuclease VapC